MIIGSSPALVVGRRDQPASVRAPHEHVFAGRQAMFLAAQHELQGRPLDSYPQRLLFERQMQDRSAEP
jgi:hypothetical protein